PVAEETTVTVADLERAAVEKKLGRKLKFKERIALSIVRGKAKRQARKKRKPRTAGPTDGFAIASLVCGILGFFTGITAILAIIFGIVALGNIERDPQYLRGRGMAIAGIVLGGVVLLLLLLLVAISAATFGLFG
ncbi:MAG: DUF4190 domain-containing protein, partial [Bacteroidota bacterium]